MPTPAIRCSYTRLADPGKLKPHLRNPNQHSAEQLRLYAKIIAHAGWRRPITVSKRSGRIIRGHGAWQVAKAAGWKKVPIEVQAYADDAQELADVLADNQLARYARDDQEALAKLVADLKAAQFDLELAGLLPVDGGDAAGVEIEVAPPPLQILIQCESERHQVQLLRELTAQGLQVRAQIA